MKRFLLVFIFGLIFLLSLVNFIFNAYSLRANFNQVRDKLMLVAASGALLIDADMLLSVPLVQSGEGTIEYRKISRELEKIKEANRFIKYAYIMLPADEPGFLQYVVDADPLPKIITAHCLTSLPGDKYDARNLPEMINAFNGPTADKKVARDAWGMFVSGYAPIRDAKGKAIAILGVDTDATLIEAMQKSTKRSGLAALFAGLFFLISFLSLRNQRKLNSLKS
jgi:hypothetical protein